MSTFDSIMPWFDRFPKEAAIIGRILAGYGELEFGLCECLGAALGDKTVAFQAIFRMSGGGELRVETAHLLMKDKYENAGLKDGYAHMIGAMRWCRKARNLYAHCHWAGSSGQGLFYIDMDRVARMSEPRLTYNHVGESLLTDQEKCFCYVLQWQSFLQHQYRVAIGKLKSHAFQAPVVMQLPKLHSSASPDSPQWPDTDHAPPQ